jgi:hypothetical protein
MKLFLLLIAFPAAAQTVYREGNTYTDKPGGDKVYIVDNVVQAVQVPPAPVAVWVPPNRPRIPQRYLTPVQLNITVTQEPRYDLLNSPATGYGRWPCTRPGCYAVPRRL